MEISEQIRKLDQRLVRVAKTIEILKVLAWTVSVRDNFLSKWRTGQPELPKVPTKKLDYGSKRKELQSIMKCCDQQHPIGRFLYHTAESYLLAVRMLEHLGRPAFTKISAELYGLPSDPLCNGQSLSAFDAGTHFLRYTSHSTPAYALMAEDFCILPQYVASEISKAVKKAFKQHKVRVFVDQQLVAKAAAGAERIRVRGSTCFSPMDIPQLIHHEALTHTLTLLNGREQTNLLSLSLGAPRTTRTQEGLALFSEFITTSIDMNRLRRISARVVGIQRALEGADFIEIFRLFLDSGQNELESFHSAMRIFRGGSVRGGVVFTKDVVYLQGLVMIHQFLLSSIQTGKVMYPHYLFAGRLSLLDIAELSTLFESGLLKLPIYEPEWVKNRSALLAFLLYSAFTQQLH